MTLPLIILAFFSITVGWEAFQSNFHFSGIIPNWFHEFVSSTLAEIPEAIPFNFVPLLTSLVVALGGLTLGWIVYRNYEAGAPDPLQKPLGAFYKLIKNKYYFDEIYDKLFVQPAFWISHTFTYLWVDRGLIDGILHGLARIAFRLGSIFRNYFDAPIVNGFGDVVGEGVKSLGRRFRVIQTGRVQQYMVIALVLAFSTLFYFLYNLFIP
jgi:NADH-quinone oxidoreductase subunit L